MSGKWRNFLTRTSWNHCTEPTSSRAVRMAAARWQRGWRKLTGDMVDCKSGVCDDWPNKFVWRWRCCCAALHVSSFPFLDRMVVGDKSKVFCFWFATLSLLFFLFSFFFLLFFHPDFLPRFVFISVSFRPPHFLPLWQPPLASCNRIETWPLCEWVPDYQLVSRNSSRLPPSLVFPLLQSFWQLLPPSTSIPRTREKLSVFLKFDPSLCLSLIFKCLEWKLTNCCTTLSMPYQWASFWY